MNKLRGCKTWGQQSMTPSWPLDFSLLPPATPTCLTLLGNHNQAQPMSGAVVLFRHLSLLNWVVPQETNSLGRGLLNN